MSDDEDDNPYLKKVRAGRAVAAGPPPAPPDQRTERAAELLAGGRRAGGRRRRRDRRRRRAARSGRARIPRAAARAQALRGRGRRERRPRLPRRAADVRTDARACEILAPAAQLPVHAVDVRRALVTLAAERGSPMLRCRSGRRPVRGDPVHRRDRAVSSRQGRGRCAYPESGGRQGHGSLDGLSRPVFLRCQNLLPEFKPRLL